ncbi:MAG: preprotein translocase subunit SecG [Thiothrix sp.]|nr:MAG: preprotein translocase subunit SecG [Thiothrix sp.]
MTYSILLVFEVLLSIALIVLILMQHGKGADAGAAFGGGSSGTVFGSKGSGGFLSRATAILAALFFFNCLALAYVVSHQTQGSSVIESVVDQAEPASPVQQPLPVDNAADIPEAAAPDQSPQDIPEATAPEQAPQDIPEAAAPEQGPQDIPE